MDLSLSDKVRAVALVKYVQPAKEAGSENLSIAVKDLLKDLEEIRFPANYVPLVCNAIKTRGFQRENGLEITGIDGPNSKMSPTVVVHYRIIEGRSIMPQSSLPSSSGTENPKLRAARLTGKLRGLLRQEIADQGGAEMFLRWVRSDDEDVA